jgi:predicted nucleic acid-binding protein
VIETVVLDAGPLGMLAHPRANPEIVDVFRAMASRHVKMYLPEIADYEVRRSLLQRDLTKSIERLDQLKQNMHYLPINTRAMLRAAQLWAHLRKKGLPTADPKSLDGDVILVAQAEQVGAAIVTENVSHLAIMWQAVEWREIAGMLRP